MNMNLSEDARAIFDTLGGKIARGGDLFSRTGLKSEAGFIMALKELVKEGYVTVEGVLEPSLVMLALISARPSAFAFMERTKRRVW